MCEQFQKMVIYGVLSLASLTLFIPIIVFFGFIGAVVNLVFLFVFVVDFLKYFYRVTEYEKEDEVT